MKALKINLLYSGFLPGQDPTRRRAQTIWEMRLQFHKQLKKFWGQHPFEVLKEWEDNNFSAGAPKFVSDISGARYVPYYGSRIGVGVSLEFVLLEDFDPNKRAHTTDADNLIKGVIDALRVPKKENELPRKGATLPQRIYCLLEDDEAIATYSVQRGHYVSSASNGAYCVLVSVKPHPLKVSLDNMAMLT